MGEVADDIDATRESAAKTFEIYGQLPSYRAMLDREGLAGPEDAAKGLLNPAPDPSQLEIDDYVDRSRRMR